MKPSRWLPLTESGRSQPSSQIPSLPRFHGSGGWCPHPQTQISLQAWPPSAQPCSSPAHFPRLSAVFRPHCHDPGSGLCFPPGSLHIPSGLPLHPSPSVPIHTATKILLPKKNLATCIHGLNSSGNFLLQSRPSPWHGWRDLHDLPSLSCPSPPSFNPAARAARRSSWGAGPLVSLFVCPPFCLETRPATFGQLPVNLRDSFQNPSSNSRAGAGAPPLCSPLPPPSWNLSYCPGVNSSPSLSHTLSSSCQADLKHSVNVL